MNYDIQKASMGKRISAFLFDGILTGIVIVAVIWLLSAILNYNSYSENLKKAYETYENQYGINFEISQEEYLALSEDKRADYDAAYAALVADTDAMYNYNMVINLTLLMITGGILLGIMLIEFVVPMLLGNGQTLGKKIFGIALIRQDGVKLNAMQLFARTLLGKFTIETMLPVYMLVMVFFNIMGLDGLMIIAGIWIAQLILLVVTRNNQLLHDLLAGTVAVDMASQMIFKTTDDLIAYQKRVAAEKATRQPY
jgi:uncharacterized RDD family membrane protein YckC